MRFGGILDRYLLREWTKIFVVTALGFPLVAIIFELTDKLDEYLTQGITPSGIGLSYVFSLPEKVFLVLPAAVLFATVFSIGTMARHSELIAGHASGRSFHRLVAPAILAALVATSFGLVLGELSPHGTRRQLELLGERERFSQTKRFNFVYRADEGWVYIIRSLDLSDNSVRDVQFEREGTGLDYPTVVVQSQRGDYVDSLHQWTLKHGRLRVLAGAVPDLSMKFDSLRLANFTETPIGLLAQAKKPEEMRYAELGRYIEALERSGGDGRRLRVDQALKIAIPFTCIIIAMFGAPLANANPKASGAFGVAISLVTTVSFLILVQLSRAVGAGGLLPPVWAAWTPNIAFGLVGLWLLRQART